MDHLLTQLTSTFFLQSKLFPQTRTVTALLCEYVDFEDLCYQANLDWHNTWKHQFMFAVLKISYILSAIIPLNEAQYRLSKIVQSRSYWLVYTNAKKTALRTHPRIIMFHIPYRSNVESD